MKFEDVKNYLNKILIFYLPGKAGYRNSITPCSINYRPVKLDRYYLDFSSKANYPGEFSDDGIPLFNFRGRTHIEQPTVIAQYALGIYELLYQKNFKDDKLKNEFLKMAFWFEENKSKFKNGVGWYFDIILPEFNVYEPFFSAMAQGEAISVLTRATFLTGDYGFQNLAQDALTPFEYDVKDGGVVDYFKSIPVYEEGPSPIRITAALNGFIFSLFGLFDLFLLNKNPKAECLFNKGVESLKRILPYYDIKHWTNYFLFTYPKKYYSSFTYHILVTEQLKVMYYLTGETLFLEYSTRWEKYSNSIICRTRALLNKVFSSNQLLP